MPRSFQPSSDLDPVRNSSDIYRVVFENDAIRIIEVHYRPGQRDRLHHHPESIVCALTQGLMKVFTEEGEEHDEMIKAGSVIHQSTPQPHWVENASQGDMHFLVIELKSGGAPTPHTPRRVRGGIEYINRLLARQPRRSAR